jgi:hypothetical protein
MMDTNGTISVQFMHPHDSHPLPADILPHCTGREALDMLMSPEAGPFIDPSRNYKLFVGRTQKEVGPEMTFAQAEVQNDDAIYVSPSMPGAGAVRR